MIIGDFSTRCRSVYRVVGASSCQALRQSDIMTQRPMDANETTLVNEDRIVPYVTSSPVGRRVLVLAPHPDDESIGCGGALLLLIKSGGAAKVVFLTKGEKADPYCTDRERYEAMREKEGLRALRILGINEHEFLRFPDRELFGNRETALQRLSMIVEEFRPDTLYCPSGIELNPDHRAAAALALALQRMHGLVVVFYELTTPLRPHILVDISPVYRKKKKAIKAYKSQLRLIDYLKYITCLNVFRTITLGGKASHAEAFVVCAGAADAERLPSWLGFEGVLSQKFNSSG